MMVWCKYLESTGNKKGSAEGFFISALMMLFNAIQLIKIINKKDLYGQKVTILKLARIEYTVEEDVRKRREYNPPTNTLSLTIYDI